MEMRDDRSLVVTLRASDAGIVGDAQFVCGPGDARYADLVSHVGGLAPGQCKPVPPWPPMNQNPKARQVAPARRWWWPFGSPK
jgi:hypothetical protein